MGEEAVDARSLFNLFPSLILAPVVGDEGVDRKTGKPSDNRDSRRLARLVGNLGDEEDAALPLKQSVHARRVILRLDGVALPIADARTGVDDRRTSPDGRSLRLENALSLAAAVRLPPLLLAGQIRAQVFFPRLHPSVATSIHLSVYELIYRLMQDDTDLLELHAPGDSFGRPAFPQVFDDVSANRLVLEAVGTASALSLFLRSPVCETRRVSSLRDQHILADLSGNRRVRASETLRDRSYRLLSPQSVLYFLPFFNAQLCVCHIPLC